MFIRHRFYFAPDTGAGSGGGEGAAGGAPAAETTDYKAENETLKVQLKEALEKIKAAESEKKEAEKARMTDAEKKKAEAAELEKMKADTLKEYKSVHLQKAGLSEEYLTLINGETRDEIAASGELLKKLVDTVRSETEAAVKKTVAKTGSPGSGDTSDEMDPVTYFDNVIKEARRND